MIPGLYAKFVGVKKRYCTFNLAGSTTKTLQQKPYFHIKYIKNLELSTKRT